MSALTLLSLINWDSIIVKFNLHHQNKAEIDTDFYLELSPQVYGTLYREGNLIEEQIAAHNNKGLHWINIEDYAEFQNELNKKSLKFIRKYEERKWQSFNFADYQAYNELLKTDAKFILDQP